MSVLPRFIWHTQRCGRCQSSRYLYGQRDTGHNSYLLRWFEYVFGQNVTETCAPPPAPLSRGSAR